VSAEPVDGSRIWLVRHAETAWSRSGQHTGMTDLELTERGRERGARLRRALAGQDFARVFSSPLSRARDTAELAGFGDRVELREELVEWRYGEYEGLTTPAIREQRPGWDLWVDGAVGGESPAQVQTRVDRFVAELEGIDGSVAVFAHGHLLRALGVRWAGLPTAAGARWLLDAGTVSVLGWKRGERVVVRWNDDCHQRGA
jgi:broad specificity phosphatase PhoE